MTGLNDAPVGLWPLTVFRTRYGGSYEGGEWAAANVRPDQIPEAALGDDDEACSFWQGGARLVGVGATAADAVAALIALVGENPPVHIRHETAEQMRSWDE